MTKNEKRALLDVFIISSTITLICSVIWMFPTQMCILLVVLCFLFMLRKAYEDIRDDLDREDARIKRKQQEK